MLVNIYILHVYVCADWKSRIYTCTNTRAVCFSMSSVNRTYVCARSLSLSLSLSVSIFMYINIIGG